MNAKYKTLFSNTIIFAIGNILIKLISFFLMPMYTSVLSTSEYGTAELLNNTIEIVLPIVTLCIVEALYRFSIDSTEDQNVLFTNSIFVLFTGFVIIALIAGIFELFYSYQYTIHFVVLYFTTSFYKLITQFARGIGHTKRYVAYGVINSLVLVITNILLLVVFDGGIGAYLTSFSIAYGISSIVAIICSREYKYFHIKAFNMSKLKQMLKYSMPNIPNMLSWWVNSLSDRYIVLFFWNSAVAGLYTAASKLPAMINLISSIFQQAWQYSTAKEVSSSDSKNFFTNVFRLYCYFCVTVCALLVIFTKLICKILLKEDFYEAWRYIPLLLLAATFGCIATYFGTFYNAIKNNKYLMISTLLGATVNILLNFILIPKYAGIGAAIATAISYLTVMIFRVINIIKSKVVELEIDILRMIFQFIILSIVVVLIMMNNPVLANCAIIAFVAIVLSDVSILKKIFFTVISLRRRGK